MIKSLAAVCAGASAGATLRWGLGIALNSAFPAIPPGTLAANLLGGYLAGLSASFLAFLPALGPEWRLLIITGFLGGLTTFSTFSLEVTHLLQTARPVWALTAVAVHVCGSIFMTFLGIATFALLRHLCVR